jgi:hypothetical protein
MYALILLMVAASHEHRLKLAYDKLTTQLHNVRLKSESAQAAEKNCAIPLIEAQKDKTPVESMPLKKPEGEFYIRQVTPPAPPCENWGK